MCEDGLWGFVSPISTCFCSASAVPVSSCSPGPPLLDRLMRERESVTPLFHFLEEST